MSGAEKKTERVNLLWPPSLKEKVREKVGVRGLSGFVQEAVEAKLGMPAKPAGKADSKETKELRDLVQRLADLHVRQGDYEDPVEQLQELGLPSWVDTTGWPDEMAEVVHPDVRKTEDILRSTHTPADPDEDLHRPMALTKPRPEPTVVEPAAVAVPQGAGGNLLERMREKAAAAGIDIEDANLRPASELERPSKSPSEVPDEGGRDTPVPPRPEAAETCPSCGAELEQGACWNCF